MKTNLSNKKRRGRPPLLYKKFRINVMLSARTIAILSQAGRGNRSEGIRAIAEYWYEAVHESEKEDEDE